MLSRMLQALMLAAVMLSITPAYAADPAPAEKVEKVVWHVDFADPRRLSAMIQSVNNMVTAYQDDLADYDVRIVFVGAGIRFLTRESGWSLCRIHPANWVRQMRNRLGPFRSKSRRKAAARNRRDSCRETAACRKLNASWP